MFKKMTTLALLVLFSCVPSLAISAGQPGTTDTVFNRKFIYKIKPMMPYEQLTKILGNQGKKVGEDKRSSTTKMIYHWNGGRKSALDIKVAAGKVVDVTVISPKKQKFSLGKSGELVDLGD
jgi:hypothetical protein